MRRTERSRSAQPPHLDLQPGAGPGAREPLQALEQAARAHAELLQLVQRDAWIRIAREVARQAARDEAPDQLHRLSLGSAAPAVSCTWASALPASGERGGHAHPVARRDAGHAGQDLAELDLAASRA